MDSRVTDRNKADLTEPGRCRRLKGKGTSNAGQRRDDKTDVGGSSAEPRKKPAVRMAKNRQGEEKTHRKFSLTNRLGRCLELSCFS